MSSSGAYGCLRPKTADFPLSIDPLVRELSKVAGVPFSYVSIGPFPHMSSEDLPVSLNLVTAEALEGYAAQ